MKTKLPKISVIIPAYNEEKYIDDCLKSLLDQTIPADEIIVVDNNSTDDTIKIAGEYNVTIIQETRQGCSHARNKGFENAKYEIIARIDADCIAPPDWIEKIKCTLKNTKNKALCGPYVYTETPNSFVSKFIGYYLKNANLIYGFHVLTGANMVITKDLWMKIKSEVLNNDQKYHEDLDLSFKVNRVGDIIFYKSLVVKTSNRRTRHLMRMSLEVISKIINTCFTNVFGKSHDKN